MLLPAEIESKTLIPALRAILAKKLAEDHGKNKARKSLIRRNDDQKIDSIVRTIVYKLGKCDNDSYPGKSLAHKRLNEKNEIFELTK